MKTKGFTLIELLLVIGILVILISATIVAINPFRQFALANNANRWSGTTTIMNAVYQRVVDNAGLFNCVNGDIPTSTPATIMASSTYDICDCLVPTYVSTMPRDPQGGVYTSCDDYNTKYDIVRDDITGRITICAPTTQIPPETARICVVR